jgi:Fe-S cluster assembly protein SufD
VVEAGARLSLVHDLCSVGQPAGHTEAIDSPSQLSDVLEIVAAENAEVNVVYLQQLSHSVHCQAYHQANLGRNARYHALDIGLGAAYHFEHSAVTLDQPGAESKLLGLFVAEANQHFRQTSLQNHLAPHTSSHLQYHSVLRDQAYSFYNGMIYVDAQAQQTVSNQLSRSLLLSEQARADAIPNLEILADDVQSGHGAAIGAMDAEQLFYLQSRGFAREQAENMLVEGFMEEVILQFPDTILQPLIKQHLSLSLLERDAETELDEGEANDAASRL